MTEVLRDFSQPFQANAEIIPYIRFLMNVTNGFPVILLLRLMVRLAECTLWEPSVYPLDRAVLQVSDSCRLDMADKSFFNYTFMHKV